jgi:kanamycin nucleotidyltransferase
MTHEERMQLAHDLCERMTHKYSDDLILGGVYGSTARGTDTAWSDLEMTFVVRDGNGARNKHFLYRGIAVGYRAIEQKKLEQLLSNPSIETEGYRWPFWMGMLSVLKVLHGDPKQIGTWLQLGQSVPREKFRTALQDSLPGFVVESYGRILSCRERGSHQDIYCAVIEVLFEMQQVLCLLNQRWVTHDYYQGLVDTFDFLKLPKRYKELIPALWAAREIDTIVPLAEELVRNYWQLLAEAGMSVINHQTVDGIL